MINNMEINGIIKTGKPVLWNWLKKKLETV